MRKASARGIIMETKHEITRHGIAVLELLCSCFNHSVIAMKSLGIVTFSSMAFWLIESIILLKLFPSDVV